MEIGNWNILDWVVVVIFALLIIIGIWRGLIGAAVLVGSVFLASFLARFLSDDLLLWVNNNFGWFETNTMLGGFISSIVIFVLVVAAALVVLRLLRPILKISIVSWVDRIGGLVLGIAAGLIVVFFGITYAYAAVNSNDQDDDFVKDLIYDAGESVLTQQLESAELVPFVFDQAAYVPDSVLSLAPADNVEALEEIRRSYGTQ